MDYKFIKVSEKEKAVELVLARPDVLNALNIPDLPPENESSFMLDWKLRKGALNGEKILHSGADYQQTPRG